MSLQSNAAAAMQFVEFGLEKKAKNLLESASGPGSSIKAAKQFSDLLLSAAEDFQITSILDLGCGDWNWMSYTFPRLKEQQDALKLPISYEGWDIHPKLVESLQNKYGSANVRFRAADIVLDDFPAVDMIICRDVLFHLAKDMGAQVVSKVLKSGAKLFLSTTFPEVTENKELKKYNHIEGWGFYEINLNLEPFNLQAKEIQKLEELSCSHAGHKRFACLYKL